jgi:hypothetical protein
MLWAITSYFNSSGYKSRLRNYRTFRNNLKVPLVAVELSFTGRFELQSSDADVLVQLVGGDVLWQKERLLNLALSHLPGDCDEVAWIDCDVILQRGDWPKRACAALKRFSMVQLFDERLNLAPDAGHDSSRWTTVESPAPRTVGYLIATGQFKSNDLHDTGVFLVRGSTYGLGWVARRALLEKHGFYDAKILGGGDKAMVAAALAGRKLEYVTFTGFNERQAEHYLKWATPFSVEVDGKIGFIDGRIFHLWHGDLKDRKYRLRQEALTRFGFDPFTDIILDRNSGCWRWNTSKPEMHEHVKDYFRSRNEDWLLSGG